jgi:SAM-dependent methyltransferase
MRFIVEQILINQVKVIVDIGCGNCRLYKALCDRSYDFEKYIGVDKKPTEIDNLHYNNNYQFILENDETSIPQRIADIVVICNVIHELTIIEMLKMLEMSRQILKTDGKLLIVDMSILPNGELEAVPLIYEDFSESKISFVNLSFQSRNGYPILAMVAIKSQIDDYVLMSKKLGMLFAQKRDSFSYYAIYFCKHPDAPINDTILAKLGLLKTADRENILGYLIYIAGAANVKLIDYNRFSKTTHDFVLPDGRLNKKQLDEIVYSDIITNIIILSEVYFQVRNKYITVNELFEEMRETYLFEDIKLAIEHAIDVCQYFFPLSESQRQLQQTNYVTDLLNANPELEEIIWERVKHIPVNESGVDKFMLSN